MTRQSLQATVTDDNSEDGNQEYQEGRVKTASWIEPPPSGLNQDTNTQDRVDTSPWTELPPSRPDHQDRQPNLAGVGEHHNEAMSRMNAMMGTMGDDGVPDVGSLQSNLASISGKLDEMSRKLEKTGLGSTHPPTSTATPSTHNPGFVPNNTDAKYYEVFADAKYFSKITIAPGESKGRRTEVISFFGDPIDSCLYRVPQPGKQIASPNSTFVASNNSGGTCVRSLGDYEARVEGTIDFKEGTKSGYCIVGKEKDLQGDTVVGEGIYWGLDLSPDKRGVRTVDVLMS